MVAFEYLNKELCPLLALMRRCLGFGCQGMGRGWALDVAGRDTGVMIIWGTLWGGREVTCGHPAVGGRLNPRYWCLPGTAGVGGASAAMGVP